MTVTPSTCIFCDAKAVAQNKTQGPFKILYNGVDWYAMEDLKMKDDKVHILIISKTCVPNLNDIKYYMFPELATIVAHLVNMHTKLINNNYMIHLNNGKFQAIPHVHWHLINYSTTDL